MTASRFFVTPVLRRRPVRALARRSSRRRSWARWIGASVVVLTAFVPIAADESVDLDVIHRIRQEATQGSAVMNHVFQMTDVSGHRLTNSPGFFTAANWVVGQMQEWGIDAALEPWGPFGRGWDYTHFSAHMIEPAHAPLIGFPLAWTPGTGGKVSGEVVVADIANEGAFNQYRGRLKGKIVFMGTGRELTMITSAPGARYTDQQLTDLETAPVGGGRGRGAPGTRALSNAARGGRAGGAGPAGGRGGQGGPGGAGQAPSFQNRLNEFLAAEGVVAVARIGGGRSDGGTVFAQAGGSRDPKDPPAPPSFSLTPEHYNRVLRLLDNGVPVTIEVEIEARFIDDRTDSVNVVAEIPGGSKRDELVIIGAHLDSWHGGTGATDNAAGCAVMIEAMRILKTLNLRLDRTVRMVLWGGEEQGLLGSRAYVTEHFADRASMQLKPEHGTFSGYFNVDNGTGRIRGVYLQGNDRMRPIFEEWFAPFADMDAGTISIRSTGGTDHTNFDAVGLPGFQFIQDPIEYSSRTHHSNMDLYDRVQAPDLQQMAAIVASFVYNTANREELLPRKPLPQAPQGGRGRSGGPAGN